MIQPGRETNIPTSSGGVNHASFAGAPAFKLDGFTVTLGMIMAVILVLLIYNTFFAKKRK